MCPSFVALHGYSGAGGRIAAANVPADYRLLTVKTSPARASQAEAYALIDRYVATFGRQFVSASASPADRIKSLYLVSESPGTGKTTTAAAVLNEYVIASYVGALQRNRQPLERPGYFLDMNAFQTDFSTFNRPRVPEETAAPAAERYYRAMEYAKSTPFVVIDDVGVREAASDAFRSDIHTIINARVTNQLPTIYTSNLAIAELERVFDRRLADRIREMTLSIAFQGSSRRGMR